jgi:putative spermidine/putrescine transport system ATP-binding protein
VVGVRPEDLTVVDAKTAGGDPGTGVPPDTFQAVVEVVEYQGHELAVEARTAEGLRLHLKSRERPGPGDVLTLTARASRLLAFPAEDDAGLPSDATTAPPAVVPVEATARGAS